MREFQFWVDTMKYMTLVAFAYFFFGSSWLNAELIRIDNQALANITAQAGIELDLDIQATIDSVAYHDADGYTGEGKSGGIAGVLALQGLRIGGREADLTQALIRSDAPFSASDLARIHDVLIEADEGVKISIGQIGDATGNGVDIVVQNLLLGNESDMAGALIIEDISNFITDPAVEQINRQFGFQLTTPDDGFDTPGGNFIPFQAQVVTTGAATSLPPDLSIPITDSLFGNGTVGNMTINAAFTLHMKKLAWVDDGGEFGFSDVLIYKGVDTTGDGLDDQIGPARLTNLSVKTVEHTTSQGLPVQALHLENVDFQADISISSIYVGDPSQSLGALHIKSLDTSGTQIWVYGH